jgi:hypothetical protein
MEDGHREREAGMSGDSRRTQSGSGALRAEVPIDPGCVTNAELAEWLKLVERNIPKTGSSKPVLREPSDPPSASRMALAIVAMIAGLVTLAWSAFLVWLALKGMSLL